MIHNDNGYCMDLGSNAVGTKLVLAACPAGYTSQWWYIY